MRICVIIIVVVVQEIMNKKFKKLILYFDLVWVLKPYGNFVLTDENKTLPTQLNKTSLIAKTSEKKHNRKTFGTSNRSFLSLLNYSFRNPPGAISRIQRR